MSERLASGPQLWRLNQAGRLQITDSPVEPIGFREAWEIVSALAAGDTDNNLEASRADG